MLAADGLGDAAAVGAALLAGEEPDGGPDVGELPDELHPVAISAIAAATAPAPAVRYLDRIVIETPRIKQPDTPKAAGPGRNHLMSASYQDC